MTRLALILNGGASLGSYVGGAVSEILYALERRESDEPVSVDVITGSSSGALNAALAARTLCVNQNLRPWIERTWLEAMDAGVLLNPERDDRRGLLDAGALDDLTRSLVDADPATDDSRSRYAGRPLRVGLSLTNLDGLPYDFRYGFLNAPDRFYGARVHRDWAEFEVGDRHRAGSDVWGAMAETAAASSSLPPFFPPKRLARELVDFPGARIDARGDRAEMWYGDGGLTDTRLISLARRLARRGERSRGDDWRYVVVNPDLRERGIESTATGGPLPSTGAAAVRAVNAVLGESAARDWREAHRANVRVEILEALAERLPALHGQMDDPDAIGLGRQIGELAERVAEMKVAVQRDGDDGSGDPALDYLEENLARIDSEPRWAPALDPVSSRAGRTRIKKLIFILETAAGLRDRPGLPLYLVAPDRGEELAGDFLAGAGGFLEPSWRAHDFRAGRRDARALLTRELSDVMEYEPGADDAYSVPESFTASVEELPSGAREKLRRAVAAEVETAVDELRPGGLAAFFSWAWKPALKRWATDRTLEALEDAG